MTSTMRNSLLCLAASALLCGAPLYAQTEPGMPGSASGTAATSGANATDRTNSETNGRPTTSGNMGQTTMNSSSAAASASDKSFVKEAMEGDMAEIQLAQLAQQKASSEGVKQFAQRMIDDHTKLDDQMKPIAQQLGVNQPTELDAKHKSVEKKLEGLSGADFDKQYIKDMVSDHKEDLSKFQHEANSAQNPELKNAASQGASVISQHLQMAENLEKNPNATQSSAQ